jgi:hypothetical protein
MPESRSHLAWEMSASPLVRSSWKACRCTCALLGLRLEISPCVNHNQYAEAGSMQTSHKEARRLSSGIPMVLPASSSAMHVSTWQQPNRTDSLMSSTCVVIPVQLDYFKQS